MSRIIPEFIIREQSIKDVEQTIIYEPHDKDIIANYINDRSIPQTFVNRIWLCLKDVFLPYGYPDSVSPDYLNYQIWDTVQAFCSTITGILTTQAVLQGIGVGNTSSSPLAAAITWILKDGTGMIGRILFTWWNGHSLDADAKRWRIFADVLNDFAMFLELSLPYAFHITTYVLCLTSTMKAIVGVAGGATRASITQHQAIKGNMADVSAKDGSQETCVNLLASVFGIFLLTQIENNKVLEWFLFSFFTMFHILANYYAVKALVFKHMNASRLLTVLRTYMRYNTVPNPLLVNRREPIFFQNVNVKMLCGFDIKLGESLKDIMQDSSSEDVRILTEAFVLRPYFMIPDMKRMIIYVSFPPTVESEDVIAAYFHAVILGIALCNYNDIALSFSTKRVLHHRSPLQRLENLLKNFTSSPYTDMEMFSLENFYYLNEFVNAEMHNFFTALNVNGWDLSTHSLRIGEWKCSVEMSIEPSFRNPFSRKMQ
ncbi:PREDICTED: RUS1 family protein C16orf58 homolog [Nicrophorus vespilloides]|uniref:RUS1 family protein C16orf58 homolog n=1 Tax=Nicrophorus vespilloides TaxID=110193 RepID=A0ABM1MH83_NICVS|nr:PREDICTED: RUS1 family protein C16orf58 homolog [Nicrophorus vespilloides]